VRPTRRLLAAPDSFGGTLAAVEAAAAIAAGAAAAGWAPRVLPLADGGEGTLDVLGGANRTSLVTGPLGELVEAGWRLEDRVAIVEAARAAGLALAGGPQRNDPVRATTRGVGELIAAALDEGAERVVVAVGGSATTDGGLGAVEALRRRLPLPAALVVACDVETRFLDAAAVFAPQKGARAEQVRVLEDRLAHIAERYVSEFGVDVTALPLAGAAGGLAGALAAFGAELVPGFALVADLVGLDEALTEVELVVTGEGRLDATSFLGKVVGGVLERALERGTPAAVVAGAVAAPLPLGVQAWSLDDRFGAEQARLAPADCIAELLGAELAP